MNPWIHIICGVLLIALGGLWAEYGRRALKMQDDTAQASKNLRQPKFTERPNSVVFTIGGNHVVYRTEVLKEMQKLSYPIGDVPATIYIEGDRPYADLDIFGGRWGAVTLRHNELINKPPQWDVNSNDSAFEIVDENQTPVFQLYYKTPTHIIINGLLAHPEGFLVATETRLLFNPTEPFDYQMKTIFKYPAWKYPGEFKEER